MHRDAARLRKSTLLTEALLKVRATVEQAELMSDEQWELAAQAAQVNPPSETTRRMVIERLKVRESRRKPSVRKIDGAWVASRRGLSRSFGEWSEAVSFATGKRGI